jgi:hypothetical protein
MPAAAALSSPCALQAVETLLEAGADVLQVSNLTAAVYTAPHFLHDRKLTTATPPCILRPGRCEAGADKAPLQPRAASPFYPQSHDGVCALLISAGASLLQVRHSCRTIPTVHSSLRITGCGAASAALGQPVPCSGACPRSTLLRLRPPANNDDFSSFKKISSAV